MNINYEQLKCRFKPTSLYRNPPILRPAAKQPKYVIPTILSLTLSTRSSAIITTAASYRRRGAGLLVVDGHDERAARGRLQGYFAERDGEGGQELLGKLCI